MSAAGVYYDGRVSTGRAVRVTVDGHLLRIEGDGVSVAHPVDALRSEPPLGSLPRRIDLPDGASCEVAPAFELPGSAQGRSERTEQWVYSLEGRWPAVIAAAVVVLAGLWATVVYGVPVAADYVARRMPASTEAQMGEQSLAILDRIALKPTALPAERQARLRQRFAALLASAPGAGAYSLQFRSAPGIGPNAFAVPGGTVVLLDELVAAAQHEDEILSVLSHEIGHLTERHSMRMVLQNSASGVVMAAVLGDVLSLSSYAAALPPVLLEASYSRDFEREADRVGFGIMDRMGIDRAHFGRLLTRLEGEHGGEGPGFLASHPRAAERARAAAGQ